MEDSQAKLENEAAYGLFPRGAGEQLRAARLTSGLDLNDVAARTRVPLRQLEAIERSDYSTLPSTTYAIGFARAYARAVGADEAAIARAVRAELGRAPADAAEAPPYEPIDPARVPSRLLAWTAAAIALVLVVAYLVWRNYAFDGADASRLAIEAPTERTAPPATRVAPPAAVPTPAGPVVLTATTPVWLRIYDKNDKVLLEKEMALGETFTVPDTADTPMVRTGRADALKVTVGGREVAPLGPAEKTIRDVGISAAALLARAAPGTATAPVSDNATQAPR